MFIPHLVGKMVEVLPEEVGSPGPLGQRTILNLNYTEFTTTSQLHWHPDFFWII
jgi:hypothetical protein